MQRLFTAAFLLLLFSACGGSNENNAGKEDKDGKKDELTADDIIAKNIEARGGYDKIKSLRTIIFEGTSLGKGVVTVKIYYDHLKAMRSDFTTNNKTGYNILTTKAGWYFNPYTDKAPIPLDQKLVKDGVFQLDIHGLFIDYKSKGYEVTYNGKDTAAGKQCYKITLTKEGEGDKVFFLTKVIYWPKP